MRSIRTVTALLLLGSAVLAQSCDGEKEALALFKRQGLNVLRPARDYVLPGGLVIVPRSGRPEYIDPLDPVPDEAGNLINFRAVIMQQTAKRRLGLGVALQLIGSIIPSPLGITGSANREVSLGQIASTGRRLTTTARDKFINSANTRKTALTDLKSGNRVFVVQEIYLASNMELTATTQQALDVRYSATNSSVLSCSANPAEKPSANASPSVPTNASSAKPGNSTPSSNSSPATPSTPGASPSLGVGVGVCKATDFSLKLTTDKAIPFAVRLSGLEAVDANTVRVKAGSEMAGSLGVQTMGAAFANEATPVIGDLTRRPRR